MQSSALPCWEENDYFESKFSLEIYKDLVWIIYGVFFTVFFEDEVIIKQSYH